MSAIEAVGHWVGRRMAEVNMILRDKPMVPCQVEWSYRGKFVEPLFNDRVIARIVENPDFVMPDEDEDCYCTDTLKEMRNGE